MNIYCITHKPINGIQLLNLTPFGVGTCEFPSNYLIENTGDNIAHKNYNYSETSFHYWYWKNLLNQNMDNDWFGMCQYRRYFVKYEYKSLIKNLDGKQGFYPGIKNFKDLEKMLQKEPSLEWKSFDVILCEPWSVTVKSKMKLIKRGLKSIINDPLIIFDKKKHNIKLHFEMSHGYDNLQSAINVMAMKDRGDFLEYISKNTMLSGHCIFLSNNTKLINNFYADLFEWLFRCEKIFGFDLKGYDTQRIYSFLTERYTPFWFDKYAKVKYWPWVYCDITKF
tara:strand:- start:822 stop:1661 length:840 start_codon:yes stop_codon:yes gene_type:complete